MGSTGLLGRVNLCSILRINLKFSTFQIFNGESGVGSILFMLVLCVVGFFLLILFIIIIYVTLAYEDKIFITSDVEPLIDNMENDTNDKSGDEKCLDVKKDSSKISTILFMLFLSLFMFFALYVIRKLCILMIILKLFRL